MPATPLVHLELHTGDLASACDFYAQLCGWLPQENRQRVVAPTWRSG